MADPVLHNGWPVDGAPDDERSPLRRAHTILALAAQDDSVPMDIQGAARDAAVVLARRVSEVNHRREVLAERAAGKWRREESHPVSLLRQGETVGAPPAGTEFTCTVKDADGNQAAGVSIAHAQHRLDQIIAEFDAARGASA